MKKVSIKEYLNEKGIDTTRVIESDDNNMYAIKSLESNVAIIGKYKRKENHVKC